MPVRVYTTKGLKDQARFGLKNAYQVVDYFSEVWHLEPIILSGAHNTPYRYLASITRYLSLTF